MKKLFFLWTCLSLTAIVSAQVGARSTSAGSILIEANTGNAMLGSTSFMFSSSDGNTLYNLGLDGGYFIIDDLAIKVGLGFGGFIPDEGDGESTLSYRIGAKYYIMSQFPLTIDMTGASGDGAENGVDETPLWLGLGGGYAWFVTDNVSIEPGLRYNVSLNKDFSDKGILQINIGFALHF